MIIAVIPAKAFSRRLDDKNMCTINGKSLVHHAIDYALNSKEIQKVYVSTDSDRIAAQAQGLGVEVIHRGDELSGDTPLLDVYKHAWQQMGRPAVEYLVGIQTDHPDRTTQLGQVIDFARSKKIDDLFTVDSEGYRNGSLRLMSHKLLNCPDGIYASSYPDDATNIHTNSDLNQAILRMRNQDAVYIGDRGIGESHPIFVVAEAACNHMCDMDLALQMIDKAAQAGADAIKFQTYTAEKLVTRDAVAFWGKEKISQLEYYKRLDRFGRAEYDELFSYCRQKNIIGFSSPFDKQNVDMLAELDMPVFKIASCDIPNLDFIQYIANLKKPIMLSTGASTLREIQAAIDTIFNSGNFDLILLACTLSYPTRVADANLRRVMTLKKLYPDLPIGLSDHTEPDPNMIIPSLAVAMGARVIEKHYTLDRTMTGSGHFFAVDPDDLKKMVDNIRLCDAALGDGQIGVAAAEKAAWFSARRSIVANQVIRKGETITESMLGYKRPAKGLSFEQKGEIIGKKAKITIEADTFIELTMIA